MPGLGGMGAARGYTAEMKARNAQGPRPMWLLSENRRAVLVTLVACLLSAGVITLAVARWEPMGDLVRNDHVGFLLMCCVQVWTTMTVLHVTVSWMTYRGLTSDAFERAIMADPAWRNRRQGVTRLGSQLLGEGPAAWPVTVSVLALVVVVALVLRPSLRGIPIALGMALVMVAAAWFNVVVAYALHYARIDTRHDSLRFPGEEPRGLGDYFYLAVGVQATFGVTDVEVRTRELRRVITGQSLLAFVFNSVIIATIVSLLLGMD